MNTLFLALTMTVALLADAPAAAAQTPASTAYTGPRYPGGPDSLRALVQRSIRQAGPGPMGLAVVQVELKEGREPVNFKLIGAPQPSKLTQATQAATDYLRTHMQAWEPGTPDPDAKPGRNPRFLLALHFATPLPAQPYPYAEQEPTFLELAALLRAQNNPFLERRLADPDVLARLASNSKGLSTFVQMQVKYPPAALRQREQGVVHVYFEVAASGAIEHTKIIGSAGDALDAEVLRAVQQLPAATTPAKLRNQPVPVFYVMPVTFKIK